MAQNPPTLGRLHELDSLRGFMALWVYLTHVMFILGIGTSGIAGLISNGSMAVSVFMILSGFAIASSLLASQASYGQYMARRFFRIYPIYLVGLLLGLMTSWYYPELLQSLGWADPADISRIRLRTEGEAAAFWPHLLGHLTLMHGAVPDAWLYGSGLSFNGPAWSLSLEMQFYLVAPLLLVLLREPAKWPIAFCALFLLALVGRGVFKPWFPQVPSFLPISLLHFLFGMLSALYLPKLAGKPPLLLGLGALLILFAARGGQILFALPVAIWVMVILICTLEGWPFVTRLRGFLAWRPFVAMGECSYGFYILHLPIIIAWAGLLVRLGMADNRPAFAVGLLATLPATLALSHLSYRYFEAPINAWAKTRFGRKRRLSEPQMPTDVRALEGI